MKLSFIGWKRVVVIHSHPVRPIVANKVLSKDESLEFTGLKASGKVSNLGLSGDFKVILELSAGDLKAALHAYAKSAPADALRLIAAAQAEAVIALNQPSEPKA